MQYWQSETLDELMQVIDRPRNYTNQPQVACQGRGISIL